MVFKIKFISDEVDGFLRELKIDSDATFLDLNKAILQSCGYPDDQMTSFHICDEEWERHEQITREDMGTSSVDEDIFVMEETKLSEFIEDEDQKLDFVFDPFAERMFYLDVVEVLPSEHLKDAVVVRSKGEAPRQLEDIDGDIASLGIAKTAAAAGIDALEGEDFYGSDDFASDEFDPEGFEISDGNPYE